MPLPSVPLADQNTGERIGGALRGWLEDPETVPSTGAALGGALGALPVLSIPSFGASIPAGGALGRLLGLGVQRLTGQRQAPVDVVGEVAPGAAQASGNFLLNAGGGALLGKAAGIGADTGAKLATGMARPAGALQSFSGPSEAEMLAPDAERVAEWSSGKNMSIPAQELQHWTPEQIESGLKLSPRQVQTPRPPPPKLSPEVQAQIDNYFGRGVDTPPANKPTLGGFGEATKPDAPLSFEQLWPEQAGLDGWPEAAGKLSLEPAPAAPARSAPGGTSQETIDRIGKILADMRRKYPATLGPR